MPMPLVSIAMPAYNCERYIGYAVRSVLNQTFEDWELLLLNDGSTDRTSEIMRSYAQLDDRIRVIDDGENRGLTFRLNQSVALARGKYYARMDADDIMHVDRLKTQVGYLTENPEIDVLGSTAYAINDKNTITSYLACAEFPDPHRGGGFIHPSVIGATLWFKQNPYSDNYHRIEDYELWLRASSHSKYYVIQNPLMFYRDSGTTKPRKYISTYISALKIAFYPHPYKIKLGTRIRIAHGAALRILVCSALFVIGKSAWLLKIRHTRRKVLDTAKAQLDLQKATNE